MTSLAERFATALAHKQQRDSFASQAGLARYCGVSGPSISDLFTGESKSMKALTALRAAEYLGVDPFWLVDGSRHMLSASRLLAQEPPAAWQEPISLNRAVLRLAEALSKDMPDWLREDAADMLSKLAMRRGNDRELRIIIQLLKEYA